MGGGDIGGWGIFSAGRGWEVFPVGVALLSVAIGWERIQRLKTV
jgi:hypothetical protein